MEKQVRKKVKIRWKALLGVVLLGVFLFFSYRWLIEIKIQNIYIEGNELLKDQEIIELAGIEDYPSFLGTFSSTMKERLLESPYIVDVKIEKHWFGEVVLKVEEAKPLFLTVDGNLILSNQKEIPNDKNLVVATAVNYIPDAKQEALVKNLSKLEDTIRLLISEIQYEPTEQDKDRFGFYMSDGNVVYITLTKFSRMNYYLDSVAQVECKRGIFNFDSGNHFEIKEDICK